MGIPILVRRHLFSKYWLHIDNNKSCIHYNDVIMGAMESQITRLTIVCSTVYSGADQGKHQSSASLTFVGGDRWIPRTDGQQRGKYFHLMTSSCVEMWPGHMRTTWHGKTSALLAIFRGIHRGIHPHKGPVILSFNIFVGVVGALAWISGWQKQWSWHWRLTQNSARTDAIIGPANEIMSGPQGLAYFPCISSTIFPLLNWMVEINAHVISKTVASSNYMGWMGQVTLMS